MLINNYYRGGTNLFTGFVFNTEEKTYKKYQLKANEWSYEYEKDNNIISAPVSDFKVPADISYYFSTKSEMEIQLDKIIILGFTEDNSILLDFGCITK